MIAALAILAALFFFALAATAFVYAAEAQERAERYEALYHRAAKRNALLLGEVPVPYVTDDPDWWPLPGEGA